MTQSGVAAANDGESIGASLLRDMPHQQCAFDQTLQVLLGHVAGTLILVFYNLDDGSQGGARFLPKGGDGAAHALQFDGPLPSGGKGG